MDKKIKLVVVGDSYVGKTSLLFAYTKKNFVDSYATTVFDNWAVTVSIDQRQFTVNLFDTAGQEDYGHLRCLSYPGTDVFLLCFSLVERASLTACQTMWMPEIRKYVDSNTPVLLVGTKEDLHEAEKDPAKRVSFDEAIKAAQQLSVVPSQNLPPPHAVTFSSVPCAAGHPQLPG